MAGILVGFSIVCLVSLTLVTAVDEDTGTSTLCMGDRIDIGSPLRQKFQINVLSLVSELTSASSSSHSGYYSAMKGENPDTVYGYFICRGDIKRGPCHDCVLKANQALTGFTVSSECYADSELCLLRYADHPISFDYEKSYVYTQGSMGGKVSNNQQYYQTWSNSMVELVREATFGNWSKDFKTQVVNVPESNEKIFTLVQCVPDLSPMNCSKCLGDVYSTLKSCCNRTQGGIARHGNCMMKFDNQSFFGGPFHGNGLSASKKGAIAVSSAIGSLFLIGVIWFCLHRRKLKMEAEGDMNEIQDVESMELDLSTIRAATNNFSEDNRLGKGGFGDVFKGKLGSGQEIAVKRLSRNSTQGILEFKNEVLLVAKLQHRNLVKLHGFCVSGRERMLIYEFLPNSSLDRFLKDPVRQATLNWTSRFIIIKGIARGLQYLHEDSRLKIIHRDLKLSNILLDEMMNAKISDFGLAKLLELDQTQGDSERIVGTYGYMAPEYAMTGQVSLKSDIYSFGIIVLEVVSGQQIGFFHQQPNEEGLLHRAWRHWNDETVVQLVDSSLGSNFLIEEVILCIHIGLLCIQKDAGNRPKMASVVAALSDKSITLPLPSAPHLFTASSANDSQSGVPVYTGTTYISELLPR